MRFESPTWLAIPFLVATLLAAGPATAEITHSSPLGFSLDIETKVAASPQAVYRHLVDNIGSWWEPSHTFSGDSKNLYVEARAKGWFGERLPNDGVAQHMEVLYADPGKTLRLRGALGPLQEDALTGIMTWRVTPADNHTVLKLTYRVGGYRPGGIKMFAGPVNQVLTNQTKRLKQFAEANDKNER